MVNWQKLLLQHPKMHVLYVLCYQQTQGICYQSKKPQEHILFGRKFNLTRKCIISDGILPRGVRKVENHISECLPTGLLHLILQNIQNSAIAPDT